MDLLFIMHIVQLKELIEHSFAVGPATVSNGRDETSQPGENAAEAGTKKIIQPGRRAPGAPEITRWEMA